MVVASVHEVLRVGLGMVVQHTMEEIFASYDAWMVASVVKRLIQQKYRETKNPIGEEVTVSIHSIVFTPSTLRIFCGVYSCTENKCWASTEEVLQYKNIIRALESETLK